VHAIISASGTAIAPPPELRNASSMMKSPMALGTRRPEAMVWALRCSAANFSPVSNARTIGWQPSACTVYIRGRFVPGAMRPSFSISSKAFHMPMRPVPPPVG
jgi:hypothetical protein